MGQFASTAFNGDNYIDIMRSLPDREIVWWIQKAIWVSGGRDRSPECSCNLWALSCCCDGDDLLEAG